MAGEMMSVREALAYLGLYRSDDALYTPVDEEAFALAVEQLEDLVVEEDVEVEVDGEGELLSVRREHLKEPLFKMHEKVVGHRPDDPKRMREEKDRIRAQAARDRASRAEAREKLVKRVDKRRGKKK